MNNKKRAVPDSRNEEILYGFNSVFEAVRAKRRKIFELFVSKDKSLEKYDQFLSETGLSGIRPAKISAEQMSFLTKSEMNQGIAARVSPYKLYEFEDVADLLPRDKAPLYLLLDSIEDSHNFGALCRTALAAGVDAVIVPKDRATGPTPTVSRVSAGALEHLRVVMVTNLVNTIKALKDSGVWISGLDGGGDKTVFDADFKGATGIVVGGEDSGLRDLVKKNCDFLISIPQTGPVNSLNASVAGAIAIYEAVRQRIGSGK